MPRSLATLSALVAVLLAACGGDRTAATSDPSGLVTVFDSSRADTIVARVAGAVDPSKVRTLTEEMRVQPGAEDTTLFSETYRFAVGRDGRLFVTDEGAQRIFIINADGTPRRAFGRKGAGPGEFDQFNGLQVLRDGRLAVLDVGNGRVSFFSDEGEFETSWRVPTGFFSNDQIRTDTSGALRMQLPIAPASGNDIIGSQGLVKLSADGSLSDSFLPPRYGAKPITFVASSREGRMQMYASYSPNNYWGWHKDGFFVGLNGGVPVVEVGRPGRPVRIERDAPSVPVGAEENDWERERILFSMRRNQPDWSGSMDLPTTKPPFVSMFTSRDGRIWVGVAMPSVEIPEAERDEQKRDAAPVRRFRSESVYEVFEATGRFVGRVAFPRRTQLMQADGDLVWALQRDDDGLPGVVRFRVAPGFR